MKMIFAALVVAALAVPALASAAPSAAPSKPVYWMTRWEAHNVLRAAPIFFPDYRQQFYFGGGTCNGLGQSKKDARKRTVFRFFDCGGVAETVPPTKQWSMQFIAAPGPYGQLRLLKVAYACASGTVCR